LVNEHDGKSLATARPYFYLEWDTSSNHPKEQAKWLENPPNKAGWKKVIRTGGREIVLYASHMPESVEQGYEGSMYDSFLKSHLQKAIRRKCTKAAVFTADLLLDISPTQVLRRLPVIMIEDSFIHESFTTLVWLMCAQASKSYVLSTKQKEWILGVVYQMTTTFYFEGIAEKYHSKNFVFLRSLERLKDIDPKIRDLIYCFEVRKTYGGLKGDMRMFSAFQNSYLSRFLTKDLESVKWIRDYTSGIRPIQIKKMVFDEREWLYSAYDFHCSPNILTVLEEEFPEYTKEDFRAVIWLKSSSINRRQKVIYSEKRDMFVAAENEKLPRSVTEIWNMIRRMIHRKAWGYFQRMLEDLNMMYPEHIKFTPREDSKFVSENTHEKRIRLDDNEITHEVLLEEVPE
jgi:hypothetical protein